jgi:protein tyrosine/serine phosphatase
MRHAFVLPLVILGLTWAMPYGLDGSLQLSAASSTMPATTQRNALWAQPTTCPGLTNFYQVSPTLYRSAQPDASAFPKIKAMGIKTIICLRASHDDRKAAEAAGLKYVNIRFRSWHAEHEDVAEFLQAALDPQLQPVLVHCQHGADRTGTMVAMYRIAVQNWTPAEASAEMTQGGYGFHPIWGNLIRYVENVNVRRLKQIVQAIPSTQPATQPAHH